ncbi:hypothetical protein SCHPADRAFT_6038 [Schizopora paradoxa]|uniref:Uncharacterized protein n=1 Tax=Schizopora paradoxa TaxID=27342 RepID=A0A0H2S9C7_9AGAM|nr:hypothetical protein SCHPADRAFT_6038 [Schizopora paradoxa]
MGCLGTLSCRVLSRDGAGGGCCSSDLIVACALQCTSRLASRETRFRLLFVCRGVLYNFFLILEASCILEIMYFTGQCNLTAHSISLT